MNVILAKNHNAAARAKAGLPRIPDNISTWLVDWSLVTIMDSRTPPRDPNDDDDEGEDDENQPDEPAVVREPDDE